VRYSPLWLLLPVQAVLLFWNLDLLAVWTDELFTLDVAPLPFSEIASRLARDIHPPLYYFQLHLAGVAAGGASLEFFRGVSAIWALALTALMDVLWLHRWKRSHRWMALSLIALSPCMLLYGRMARSYSMQATLAFLAVWALRRWLKEPSEIWRRAVPAVIATTALLYTHYVPGLAVLSGFALIAARRIGWFRSALLTGAVLFLYAPWLWVLAYALSRWRSAPDFSSNYTLTGWWVTEQFVKIGFGWTSLAIGESFPAASLALTVFLLLLLALAVRHMGILHSAAGLAVAIAAILGYVAVSRWVSYPFTPARLLWLLPFLVIAWTAGFDALRPASARWMFFSALLLSHLISISYYFQKRDYLNPGYSAPLREIAARINSASGPVDVVLLDAYNTDGLALGRYLKPQISWMVVNAGNESQARARWSRADSVWVVRNARDISPGRVSARMEEESCLGRVGTAQLWHPYAEWQIMVMRWLDIEGPPRAFYRVTHCRAPG